MRLKAWSVAVVALSLAVGCKMGGPPNGAYPSGGGPGGQLSQVAPFGSLDIVGAKSLMLTGGSLSQASAYRVRAANPLPQLFKVDDAGKVTALVPKTATGDPIPQDVITGVYYAGPNFVVVHVGQVQTFPSPPPGAPPPPAPQTNMPPMDLGIYLVRKSDGKAANLNLTDGNGNGSNWMPPNFSGGGAQPPLFQSDAAGNIYLMNSTLVSGGGMPTNNVIKVTVPQDLSTQVTKTTIGTNNLETFNAYEVDPQGNILAALTPANQPGSMQTTIRLYKAGGSVQNITVPGGQNLQPYVWPSKDGTLYVATSVAATPPQGACQSCPYSAPALYQVSVDGAGNVATASFVQTNLPGSGWASFLPNLQASVGTASYFAYGQTGYSAPTPTPSGGGSGAAVYGFANGYFSLKTNLAHIAQVTSLVGSAHYLYALGKDAAGNLVVDRYDPTANVETQYAYNGGQYQIFNMTVSQSDVVSVSALRFSDGAYVMGTLDPAGNVTVTSQTAAQATTVLQLQ